MMTTPLHYSELLHHKTSDILNTQFVVLTLAPEMGLLCYYHSMDTTQYSELTGLSVSSAKENLVTAQIARTQTILEQMLGYTLDPDLYNQNQYTEIGKTTAELPFPSTSLTLNDPDAVVFAYRLYDFNNKDLYLPIDPCSAVHKVKLVKDGVTYKTFDTDEIRLHYKQGFIKYVQLVSTIEEYLFLYQNYIYYANYNYNEDVNYLQLAVDATWLWSEGQIPQDLLFVWADMVTYYSNPSHGIKSQTLGSHSYTRFDEIPPEQEKQNINIIKKYSGPLGSIHQTPTV